MENKVRVRFAPAPSSFLHIGGARTALYNWLYARRFGGTFVLRIEDTNVERSSAEMARAILDSLQWLGITWDEGPYYQSQRSARHAEVAATLLEAGEAYRCFCSREAAEEEKIAAMERGEPKVYAGTCRALDPDEVERRLEAGIPHVLRFRMPAGETRFIDQVYGEVTVENATIGDFVLVRSDGTPTYNLAVVVDDADMRVTHVIRGEDHLPNTPKQIRIYEALGLSVPVFAHLPLILGTDKKKLSKRMGATSVGVYRDEGILPEALFNFISLLGWSPGDDRELMSREEIVEAFSLDRVGRRSAVFDPTKLDWMNGEYISSSPPERLAERVTPLLEAAGLFEPAYLDERREWYYGALRMLRERAQRIGDLVERGRPLFTDEFEYDPEAVSKRWKSPATAEHLAAVRDSLTGLDDFTAPRIEGVTRDLAESLGVSAAKLIHPVRVAVTGKAVGPSLFELLELLGRDRTVARIDRAIAYLRSNPGPANA